MRFFVIVALVLFFSCEKKSENQNFKNIPEKKLKDSLVISIPEKLTKEQEIEKMNSELISLIQSKKYVEISEFIHPQKGLNFLS